jgi:7-methyl-GTP pyrophosphatase
VSSLILASTSAYRRQLLSRLAVSFETHAPGVEEAYVERESPADRALRLALEKARAVLRAYPEAVVIGADQVATCGDQVLDKPGSAARARTQLETLSGRTAQFHTACAVLGAERRLQLAHLDTTTVAFRHLSPAEIDRYVALERPFDCAGAFRAESLGISLLEFIDSRDPTALIGLPLIWLAAALREAGFRLP